MGIRGSTGRLVDLINPQPESFEAEDIARALSFENRYAGNYGPYSVAQHSVLVARYASKVHGGRQVVLSALHHDDAEAVTGDVPRPVKRLCPELRALERRLEAAINLQHGIEISHPVVVEADMAVFKSEIYRLVPPDARWLYEPSVADVKCTLLPYADIAPWGPERAFAEYMDLHTALVKR